MVNPLRGELRRVDMDPAQRSETGKIRPVVVIGDEQLGRLPVRVVVPITGWNKMSSAQTSETFRALCSVYPMSPAA